MSVNLIKVSLSRVILQPETRPLSSLTPHNSDLSRGAAGLA